MGKVKEFSLTFAGGKVVYRPGEIVSGTINAELYESMKVKGVRAKLQGQAFVTWEESSVGASAHGSSIVPHFKNETLVSTENYVHLIQTVFGKKVSESGPHLVLKAGKHSWPFKIRLPQHAPSSFEGKYGGIRYMVRIEIDKPFPWPNETRVACFTVLSNLDINEAAYQRGYSTKSQKRISKFLGLGDAGVLQMQCSIDKRGYCPGEDIKLNIQADNSSSKNLGSVHVQLMQTSHFEAEGEDEFNTEWCAGIKGEPLLKNSSDTWKNIALTIPPVPPSSQDDCRIINVRYEVKFFVDVPNGFDLKCTIPVTIGTVPYRPPVTRPVGGATAAAVPEIDVRNHVTYTKCTHGICKFTETDSASFFPGFAYTPYTVLVSNRRPEVRAVPSAPSLEKSKSSPQKAPAQAKEASSQPQGASAQGLKKGTPAEPQGARKTNESMPVAIEDGLLMIRFSTDRLEELKKDLLETYSFLVKHSGHVVGIAPEVTSTWKESRLLALIHFPTVELGLSWVMENPKVKDTDWLGGCEMLMTLLKTKPTAHTFFSLTEASPTTQQRSPDAVKAFSLYYRETVLPYRQTLGGKMIAQASKYEMVRGEWMAPPSTLTLVQWPKKEAYDQYKTSDVVKKLVTMSQGLTSTSSSTSFAVVPLIEQQKKSLQAIDDVMAILRFPAESVDNFEKDMRETYSDLQKNGGNLLGVAPEVQTKWKEQKLVALLHFPSMASGESWVATTPKVADTEWLGGCDVVLVKLKMKPKASLAFTLVEATPNPSAAKAVSESYVAEYRKTVLPFKQSLGAVTLMQGTSYTSLRGSWVKPPRSLTLTQWPSLEKYKEYKNSAIQDVMNRMNGMNVVASSDPAITSAFELTKLSFDKDTAQEVELED